jgi:LacI family transcriptional regulator
LDSWTRSSGPAAPIFADVAKAISSETRKHGYSLFISSSDDDPELEAEGIKQLLARRVDVIMVASVQWSVDCFRLIEEQKTPYILIGRRFQGLDANFVGVHDQAVGALAKSHLIE